MNKQRIVNERQVTFSYRYYCHGVYFLYQCAFFHLDKTRHSNERHGELVSITITVPTGKDGNSRVGIPVYINSAVSVSL